MNKGAMFLVLFLNLSLNAWEEPHHPYFLILQGSASAGKSSLCKALHKQKPDWQLIDEDDINTDYLLGLLEKEAPEHLTIIKNAIDYCNLFHAIERNEVCFKKNLSFEQIEEAKKSLIILQQVLKESDFNDPEKRQKTICRITLETTEKVLESNKSVILDDHLFKDGFGYRHYGEEMIDLAVDHLVLDQRLRFVLITCSFDTLVQRTLERNKQAQDSDNFSMKRMYYWTLSSYFDRYEFSLTPSKNNIAQTSLSKINNAFETIKQDITNKGSSNASYELTIEQVEEMQEKVVPKTASSDDIIYIILKDPSYYYIVNTDGITPEQAAQKVLDIIER